MRFNKIYNRLRYPGETLSERVIHGGFWVFALRIIDRSFMLVRTIILARLLAPNDFGLFGIAMLALAIMENFSQTGIDAALIQKKEDIKPYLDTAWTIQVLREIGLALILYFTAPLVAGFFEEPSALMLTRILGIGIFLRGFRNIGIIYFRKELEFHKQFVYQFSITFANIGVSITAAYLLQSVWALIFGFLAGNFVGFIISYLLHSYRPKFDFNFRKIRQLFNYSKWIWVTILLGFIFTKGDDIFVGKILGATALGFYNLAFQISNLPINEITGTITMVIFPTYSRIQDDLNKLRNLFFYVFEFVSFIVVPFSLFIFFLSYDFTKLFLGEKWLPMVPALKILAFYGMLVALTSTISPIFKATGRPKENSWLGFLRMIPFLISVYPLTKNYGILGTSISILFGVCCTIPFFLYKSSKIINIKIKDIFIKIYPILISSIFMSSFVYMALILIENMNYIYFVSIILIGVTIYIGITYIFWKFWNRGPISAILILKDKINITSTE